MEVVEKDTLFYTNLCEEFLHAIECPFCGDTEVTFLEYQGWFCNTCNTELTVGPTCGDPGYVVRADPRPAHTEVIIVKDNGKEETINPITELDKSTGKVFTVIKDYYFKSEGRNTIQWHDEDMNIVREQKIDLKDKV